MKIKIICFGKIKDKNITALINEYISKINHFTNLSIVELSEEKINNENSIGEIEEALKKESKKLIPYLENSFNILLDIKGIQMDSIKFANSINQNLIISKDVNFYIGSSHGISESIKNKFNLKLSFSPLTFNHQIFRLILLEQIYRAFSILNNTKYHK